VHVVGPGRKLIAIVEAGDLDAIVQATRSATAR